jgi:hypothetical protein
VTKTALVFNTLLWLAMSFLILSAANSRQWLSVALYVVVLADAWLLALYRARP